MKFAFVATEKASFPVAFMCRHLEVSRRGFYAWRLRPESHRAKEDRRLRLSIRAAWKKSRRTYGSHRLHEDLREDGEKVSRKANCWDNAVAESFFGTMKAELETETVAGAWRHGLPGRVTLRLHRVAHGPSEPLTCGPGGVAHRFRRIAQRVLEG